MKNSKGAIQVALVVSVLALLCVQLVSAEDPCANVKRRALVLSGGGSKGAFQAGAIYHLVVHRHCDFHEFSGSSVGALNGAFLAQAERSTDSDESLANLASEAEGLVSLWHSIKSSTDIRKERRFARLRWGLFGLDSLNDMSPLHQLLDRNISIEKLAKGRPVRASIVSFWSGEYREVVAKPELSKMGGVSFIEYLYASSTIPVYSRLPRIPEESDNPKMWPQFSDSSLRHMLPLSSYFKVCNSPSAITTTSNGRGSCAEDNATVIPPHEPVQQLFVIATTPYSRDSDELPITDVKCCRAGTRQITDGRKILERTLALMSNSIYRSDLNFSLIANDIVRWRWLAYTRVVLVMPVEQIADAKQRFLSHDSFAIESYNPDNEDPWAPSRPYEIGLVLPKKGLADPAHLLVLSPPVIQQQLYCGCVAADEMMTSNFGLPSLSSECTRRFPRLIKAGRTSSVSVQWNPSVCNPPSSEKVSTLELASDIQLPVR
jgi:predicted acylesterase/phospholipase RssA